MSGYRRSGPSPILIVAIGALLVFGGYFVWTGFLGFLEDQGKLTAPTTREAIATATAGSIQSHITFPTAFVPVTFTPLPSCQTFIVSVERAVYRDCPRQDDRECPIVEVAPAGTEFCVYGRVPDYPEWYIIDLNAGGAYRDLVYMHESVIEALNPTATPSATFTPRPTISPMPTLSPTPTVPISPTPTPDPALPSVTPTPSPPPPTIPASPTLPRITI